ncbi:MAG: Lrp/AsnC family transcriptional regulator [Dehalococcoidia bacterium]|jgi:Lrp/AsnC family transcriptional regulator for asnA, asnC and gidA|nr:Lrp/AsnC family transcriptional regulator [Dehalococcoidia bacterium]HJN59100.1 Lrp/AsnC family transcriptional regulator [Dehalococcoidia bacterium]
MDKLDYKIVSMLKQDGRLSNANVARVLKVSEGTIRRRLKRMTNENIIRIFAVPNPESIGLHSEALIGIQVDPDKMEIIANKVSKLEQATWVAHTTGTYDIFLWAAVESTEELGKFIRGPIGTIPGVRRTETFVNLRVVKRGHGPRD